MIETKSKVIDGKEIEVTQFPARKAFKYKIKLLKYISPLSNIFKTNLSSDYFNSKKSIADSDISIDLSGIDAFVNKLSEDKFLNFVLVFLSSTRIDGKEITEEIFDMEFTGKMTLVYKILFYIIEVNYPDFFEGGGIGKILKLKKETIAPVKTKNSESKE